MNPLDRSTRRPRRPAALALLVAAPALLFAPLPGQAPGELPTWQVDHFVAAIGRGQIAEALRVGLNSPGDAVTLHVQGGLSVGAGVNVGAALGLEATAVRLETGGVEVSIADAVALQVGVEAYEGLELNAGAGVGRRVLLTWPTAAAAADGLAVIAGAHQLALSSLGETAHHAFQIVRYAAEALREAIANTRAAQAVHDGLARANAGAVREVERARAGFQQARRDLAKLRAKVQQAQRRVGRLPRWLRGPARFALRVAQRTLARGGVADRAARAGLDAAEATADAALAALRGAQAALDHAWRDEDAARRMYEHAQATAGSAREFALALTAAADEITGHVSGVEFTLQGGAELSAAVNPAGVSLENVGAGVSAASCLGGRVGYRIVTGGAEQLSVAVFHDVELVGWAGMGVGYRSEIGSGLEIAVDWRRPAGARGYAFDDLQTTLYVDAAVMAVAGAGVAVRHGVGEHVAFTMDARQWQQAWAALGRLGGGLTAANLTAALRGMSCDVGSGMRWITAVVANAGGSYAGTGITFDSGATWQDEGLPLVQTVDAGQLLEQLLAPAWATATEQRLAARL